MTEWVDGVVLVMLGVPQHSAPEADIDGLRACRDGELDLLGAGAVRTEGTTARPACRTTRQPAS
jgi:hypothetical protein